MRILLVIPSITNFFTFLEELTDTLIAQGHEVALASSAAHFNDVDCYETKPRCEFFPIELPRAMNPFEHSRAAKQLLGIVREFNPDIVHCHTGAGIFTTSIVAWSGVKNVRFIATHHGMVYPLINGIRRYLIGPAERWSLRQLDSVHLLNQVDQNDLARFGITNGIHLYRKSKGIGCRIDQFDPQSISPSRKAEMRKKLNLNEDDFVFIYVGRQVWFKGFDLVVKAFFEINKKVSNAKLLLLGEPYLIHPTGLTEAETQLCETHPDIRRIGWVQEVQDYLSISDLNLFPSEREGMPVNLMESICMGVPVITLDSRGCNEIVEHEKSGYLMNARDIEELMELMLSCVDQPENLQALKAYCLGVRGRFDRKLWIDEQIDYYRKLLQNESCKLV